MAETLISVGLDIGTTSSQMIVSELTVENRASSFAVPDLEIARRNIRYRGKVHFTPLLDESHVDAAALKKLVEEEYQQAGIQREMVDTGAVIITGETSRRENARAVMEILSDFAGDFVVATAGPDLESVLAAKGAGAVSHSEETGEKVLHLDIGGGTSNLSFIEDGKILYTGCLNVGGRLVKIADGMVSYTSPVLAGLTSLKPGQRADVTQLEALADTLVQALEMAAGLREPTELLSRLTTREVETVWKIPEKGCTISFSGGVADCIGKQYPPFAFGDMGPILGQAIRKSRLCQGKFMLGQETIRATVIGAGCHSAQLSGSTVFCQNIKFPLKNLPVVSVSHQELPQLEKKLRQQDTVAMVALDGFRSPSYRQVSDLASTLARELGENPAYLCVTQDMAKALGQALALRLGKERPILCIDRVRVRTGSFLDVGAPVGPALPVVVKTLVLER